MLHSVFFGSDPDSFNVNETVKLNVKSSFALYIKYVATVLKYKLYLDGRGKENVTEDEACRCSTFSIGVTVSLIF